jgi:hypothetical protein
VAVVAGVNISHPTTAVMALAVASSMAPMAREVAAAEAVGTTVLSRAMVARVPITVAVALVGDIRSSALHGVWVAMGEMV